MLTILITIAGTGMAAVLVLLAVVVVGIRQEAPAAELTTRAPTRLSSAVRRLIGVSVRKPDARVASEEQHAESCPPAPWPAHRTARRTP
jgi:hypothetical protein